MGWLRVGGVRLVAIPVVQALGVFALTDPREERNLW
jgi:hypothetical protein